jgi:PRTRC genetic system ThiF family protein
MKHYLPDRLARTQVKILLVGAGGTGSRILENLVLLHKALLAKGHPQGLHVTVVDDDTVSTANVGRQAFYACDVGSYKALTLVNRANMALGNVQWRGYVGRLTTKSKGIGEFDLVIGAVDNRSARLAILRSLERCGGGTRYWLDTGNGAAHGQVLLGEVTHGGRKTDDAWRLPHAGEMFPEAINSKLDSQEDDLPSCSLAEALEKQELFVNPTVATAACNILWLLFTRGEISSHGAFINLEHMTTRPIEVDQEVWARFGVKRTGRREKVKSTSS